ncbi:hypothetical protein SEPCBS57363_004038 [Sporothrix epigloea]|uniref:Uncharacterized protein n=1 Tax=Sporothrix epigloea TaxID=1892477 RepID=A0ABP0DPU9_9PEZI
MPTPSSPLSSGDRGYPVFGASPMTIRVAVPRPLTPRRANQTSPISINSSPDSFPPSPIHARTTQDVSRQASLPSATSTSFSSLHRSLTDEIQDSDEDGFGSGSDARSDSLELLHDVVHIDEPSQRQASLSSSSLSSVYVSETSVRRASSSTRHNSSSAAPSVTKRCAAAAVLTSPLPRRRVKQPRASWQVGPPPTHKFDMMALLRHAKQEDATDAAARRVSDIFAESKAKEIASMLGSRDDPGGSNLSLGSAPLLDGLLNNSDDFDLEEGGESNGSSREGNVGIGSFNKDRLRKAFDRTEVAAVSESWYFFKEHFASSPAERRPFPQDAAAPESRWAFLRDKAMRQDFFMMGVVRKAIAGARQTSVSTDGDMDDITSAVQKVSRNSCLPDEIFLWILDEAYTEAQPALCAEYTAVLGCCNEQICRLVDAERLVHMFQKLGPRWESIDLKTHLELVPAIHRPYPGRDWSLLCSVLRLVSTLAGSLGMDALGCAVKILVRLGIDRVVEETPAIIHDYQEAVRKLVQRVSSADWDNFVCIPL